jgi:hypothetical protein
MTTYSNIIGKNVLADISIQSRLFYKLNLVLLISAIFMAFAYIFLANFIVAQKYSLNLRKNELNALNAQTELLNNEYQLDQDLKALLLFTERSGMIEAKDIDSILQDRGFALGQPN